MREPAPILHLLGVFPDYGADLRVMPGDCILIDARDRALASAFADLCCGLPPAGDDRLRFLGHVRFLGRDWTATSHQVQAAMRGRIGRTYGSEGWIESHGADVNILAAQLHHTRRPEDELREAAATLAQQFGLPGLPLALPNTLIPGDLARADCVRAFLGNPRLLIIQGAELEQFVALRLALVRALTTMLAEDGAAIWLTGSNEIWRDRAFPATQSLRLTDRGLAPVPSPH